MKKSISCVKKKNVINIVEFKEKKLMFIYI